MSRGKRALIDASVEVWRRLRASGMGDEAIREALAPLSSVIADLQPPESRPVGLVRGDNVTAAAVASSTVVVGGPARVLAR